MRSYAASSSDGTLPSPTFEIKIQRIDGSSQRVDVSADMTGLQLKELIAQKLGISMEQRLICRGRAIKDDDLIGAHVTENGQIVHMVQRPPPGPPPPPGGSAAGPPAPVPQPGMPPMMPGMAVPFSSQSQVLHIAMPDFMTGMAPGPGPGPMPPVPPGPPFVGPDRNAPGGMHLMQAVEAAQAAWRGNMEVPRQPPMATQQPPSMAMRGVPLPGNQLPHGHMAPGSHVPLPPPMAPMATAFGVPPPMAAMPPPHFPPPMPAPMHVVLQGFPGQGLAQVIPQLLAEVPHPPRPTANGSNSTRRREPELPWRELRRLHSHLTVALGRSSGYRPANLPPDGLAPEAEMRAFLTSLHAATSQLGVAVSDLAQFSDSLLTNGTPTRQQLQFTMVLASAGRVFRSLSTAMASQPMGAPTDPPPYEPPPQSQESTENIGLAMAPVELRCGVDEATQLLMNCWQQTLPSVALPHNLSQPYVFLFLQEVRNFLYSSELMGTPDAAERYPHLNSLLLLR